MSRAVALFVAWSRRMVPVLVGFAVGLASAPARAQADDPEGIGSPVVMS